jgi:hypothetical protein
MTLALRAGCTTVLFNVPQQLKLAGAFLTFIFIDGHNLLR